MPHVRYRGNWDEIRFRDYLIQHNDVAAAFEALKLQLAEKYKNDRVTIFTLQNPLKFSAIDIIFGTKGYTNCQNKIFDYDDNIIWEYEYPLGEDGKPTNRTAISPYDQEMINFVTAVRTKKPVNQVEELTNSTITGIMGRESAYSGKEVTWEETMNSDLRLGPEEYNWGPVDIPTLSPLPGKAPVV